MTLITILSLPSFGMAVDSTMNAFDVFDGTGNRQKTSLGAKPFSFFRDSLFLYSMELQGDHSIGKYGLTDVRLDTIGSLGPLLILDMRFVSNDRLDNQGKAILLDAGDGRYDIVQLTVGFGGKLESSKIVTVQGAYVLHTRSRYSGQTSYYLEDYWVWCEKTNTAESLRIDAITRDTLQYVLPEGSRAKLDGKLEILSLTVTGKVFGASDHLRTPTGGSIRSRYLLDGCELSIDSIEYDSANAVNR